MAVYTVLDRDSISAFIKPYGIGPLIDFRGVAEGIENTNYFISTDQSDFPSELRTKPVQHFVLTIFESISAEKLRFYIDLTSQLNEKGLPVPCPLENADGIALQNLEGKPALLIPKVSGEHPLKPTLAQCQTIARTLANIHLACLNTDWSHESDHNLAWLAKVADSLASRLAPEDATLLDEISRFQQRVLDHPDLPRSIIHGDLFRDNVLYEQDQLTAIIDFYSAGNGYLLFDLAVLVNDWCSIADGSLNLEAAEAIIAAYQSIRPFSPAEQALWNDFLRIAAVRFWVSRLETRFKLDTSHRPGGLVEHKDPQQYKNILLQRINKPMTVTK
jgi:homoserine kinase type II